MRSWPAGASPPSSWRPLPLVCGSAPVKISLAALVSDHDYTPGRFSCAKLQSATNFALIQIVLHLQVLCESKKVRDDFNSKNEGKDTDETFSPNCKDNLKPINSNQDAAQMSTPHCKDTSVQELKAAKHTTNARDAADDNATVS